MLIYDVSKIIDNQNRCSSLLKRKIKQNIYFENFVLKWGNIWEPPHGNYVNGRQRGLRSGSVDGRG